MKRNSSDRERDLKSRPQSEPIKSASVKAHLASQIKGSSKRARQPKIAVVQARFNSNITNELFAGVERVLNRAGIQLDPRFVATVPGAVEIPIVCEQFLSADADAVIALGCVIRGETTHYESVINAFEMGAALAQHRHRKPIIYGVLTVENLQQAEDRIGGKAGHKGEEAAETALEMVDLLKSLRSDGKRPKKR